MKYIVNMIVLCLLIFISCNIDKGGTEKQSDNSIVIAENVELTRNDSVCLHTAISFTPSLHQSICRNQFRKILS